MATGTMRDTMTCVAGSGWAESWYFFVGGAGAPDDLTGMTGQLVLLRPGRPAGEALSFNSTDEASYVTVAGNALGVTVPAGANAAWSPGVYDVTVRVIDPAAQTDRYTLLGPGRLTVQPSPF